MAVLQISKFQWLFFLLLSFVHHSQCFLYSNPQIIQRQIGVQSKSAPSWFRCSSSRGDIFMSIQSDPENSISDFQAIQLSSKLKGTNIYLVGLMGTGKSTVGKLLAEKLRGYAFLDTDVVIEDVAQKPIPKIFEDDGEDVFRTIESSVLDQVCAYVRCVVGTGGGVVCKQENWSYLQTGLVVWLNMDVEDIVERLTKDERQIQNRPLLKDEDPQAKLQALLDERSSFYEQADVKINIAPFMDHEMVCSNIIEELLELIEKNPPKYKGWKKDAQERGTI